MNVFHYSVGLFAQLYLKRMHLFPLIVYTVICNKYGGFEGRPDTQLIPLGSSVAEIVVYLLTLMPASYLSHVVSEWVCGIWELSLTLSLPWTVRTNHTTSPPPAPNLHSQSRWTWWIIELEFRFSIRCVRERATTIYRVMWCLIVFDVIQIPQANTTVSSLTTCE